MVASKFGSRSVVRKLGALGALATLSTIAGCAAVSHADTAPQPVYRSHTSIFASLAGTTTADVTASFPSSTTSAVVDSRVPALADGTTTGNLTHLAPNAAWTVDVSKSLDGLRLGNFYGSAESSPMQIGDVLVVSLNSSVLNTAGVAAFSMGSGELLWQDRSLECQRVNLGGALPCRQNGSSWMPFNPASATFGEAFDPGFEPEVFGMSGGVLYSARTSGSGALQVAAGSIAAPAEQWSVTVPRAADAMVPGTAAEIEVADTVKVRLGAAEIELTKAGTPLTAEAQLIDATASTQPAQSVAGVAANPTISIAQTIGDIDIVNTSDDRILAFQGGEQLWELSARATDKHTVTDGKSLTFVRGTEQGNKLTTISLADGTIIDERSIVALAAQPKSVQSATKGLFNVDKQFSTISYYPAS